MVNSGQAAVSTPGTAVQVDANEANRFYLLRAHPDNAGNIALGDESVTMDTGMVLSASDGPVPFDGKLSELYFDADNADDKLCWIEVS